MRYFVNFQLQFDLMRQTEKKKIIWKYYGLNDTRFNNF